MSTVETAVAATEPKAQFSERVQALINAGRITVKSEEVKISADASPSGEELTGSFDKLSGSMAEALEYLDGDTERAGTYLWNSINTVRKNSARQTIYNEAVPSEDKAVLSMARKAIKGGVPGFEGLSEVDAVAKIKAAFAA